MFSIPFIFYPTYYVRRTGATGLALERGAEITGAPGSIEAMKTTISLLIKFNEGPATLKNPELKLHIRNKSFLLNSHQIINV